jgi:broad specificity phosphatase PhoE
MRSRTQQTVEPTATALGLTPVELPAAAINELVDPIESDHRGDVILVVGHSDTVPAIIERLGISPAPVITENEFDNLFVVILNHFGRATFIHLKYGSRT